MIVSSQLVASVAEAWKSDQNHPHRDREKLPLPDFDRLGALLDIAFKASLVEEEGRPTLACLTWASPEHIYEHEIPTRRETPLLVRFVEPRTLEPELIGKLGGATTGAASSILIDWQGQRPIAWGLLYYTRSVGPFREIPVTFGDDRHFAPDCFSLEIRGPGSLVITREDSVIGRIERGEFKPAIPTPFSPWSMGPYLDRLFGIEIVGGKFKDKESAARGRLRYHCLDYLVWRLDRSRHGATLIFVPSAAATNARAFVKSPWDFAGSLEIGRILDACLKYRPTDIASIKAKQTLSERLNALARMASLDGAVVIDENFEVLAFGAKLTAPAWEGRVVEGPSRFHPGGSEIDFSRLGTRHNSALALIGALPGSVAFVVSSDGPIRGLVRKSKSDAACWPDCRVSMFA